MSHSLVRNVTKTKKYDVYVGRPSQWGNPFVLRSEEDRDVVLSQYRHWLIDHPEIIEAAQRELKGKTLGCFCAPKACHADVLAEFANRE